MFCCVDDILCLYLVISQLLHTALGKMPIVAKLATIVATCGAGAVNPSPRPHVVAGFLFNGVDLQCRRFAIDNGVIGPISVFTIAAKGPVAVLDHTCSIA